MGKESKSEYSHLESLLEKATNGEINLPQEVLEVVTEKFPDKVSEMCGCVPSSSRSGEEKKE